MKNKIIIDSMFELSHYKLDEELKPSYFDVKEICDEFGLSTKEAIDIAKESGYNVYKFNEDYLERPLVIISCPELTKENVLEDINNYASIFSIDDKSNSSFNESFVYGLYVNDIEKPVEVGSKQEIEKIKKHLEEVSPVDSLGRHNKFKVKLIGKPSWESLQEDGLDLEFVNAKHLANIFDRDGNLIETKIFQSRPQLDRYLNKYSVYDMSSSKDIVDYKNKKFVGSVWKVVVDLPKEESLKEDVNDDFWNLRSLKEPKYGTGNLVIDGDTIRPLTKDELKFKFAVSIEHADKNDFKTKEELIDFANKTGAKKIMFYFEPGDNYSGEYSFLYDNPNKEDVEKIAKEYTQKAYGEYDRDGEYHEIKMNSTHNESLNESRNVETLYYNDLKITVAGDYHPETWGDYGGEPAYYDDEEIEIDYEYNVDKDEVKDALLNIVLDKEKLHLITMDEEALLRYIDENYDELFDKYNEELLEYFEERAREEAEENYESPDLSWDDRYGEGLKEDIEKHDTLNPKLFDGEELRPEVKETIEKIANTFVQELNDDGIRFTLKDIVLLGSNVSYNYTKDSDLDIHLIADSNGLECPDDLYPLLYSAYRSIFNKNYEIKIRDIPAEIYVEMDEPQAMSNGIYSLNNGWIKKPEQKAIPELDREAFDKLFKEWEDKYFDLLERINEELSDDIYDFIEDLYDLRKESIASEGEYGLGNLVFKEFRNLGYLDNLKELRKQEKGKELSLESVDTSSKDDIIKENSEDSTMNDSIVYGYKVPSDMVGYYKVEFFDDDGRCLNHWLSGNQIQYFKNREDAVKYIDEVRSWNVFRFTQTLISKIR